MPIRIRKTKGGKYKVTDKGRVTAKGTTKRKARRQADLIRAVDHGWHPTGRRKR